MALGGALAIAVVVGLTVRKEVAVSMILDTSAPEYAPVEPPPEVAEVVEVERPGATVRAWVIEPARRARGTVFLLHGIRDRKETLLPSALRHADHGFRVVAVDSRGHGESSGRHLTYGVRESEDLRALADELSERGLLAEPLMVVGASYGAATAVRYGAIDDRVASVVAMAPFASLREVVPAYVEWILGPVAPAVSAEWTEEVVNEAGRRAGFDPDDACPLCFAPRIGGSLFVIHGRADERIPYSHGVRVERAATNASRTRLLLVDGADHTGIGQATGVPEAIDAWLDEVADESAGAPEEPRAQSR